MRNRSPSHFSTSLSLQFFSFLHFPLFPLIAIQFVLLSPSFPVVLISKPAFDVLRDLETYLLTLDDMSQISLMARKTGSFMTWLSSSGGGGFGRHVMAVQPASSTSSSRSKAKGSLEILPGVTLDQLPTKPSRPPTPFNLYFKEKYTPGKRAADQMKELAESWKHVSGSEKTRYENMSQPAMEKYKRQMIEYSKFMTQKLTLTQVAQLLKAASSVKVPSNPRGKSGYNVFLAESCRGIQGKPDLKSVARQWSSLSQSEKQKWVEKAEKENRTLKAN